MGREKEVVVVVGSLLGAAISHDDALAGAAVGSVLGWYLAPVAAPVAYALSNKEESMELSVPVVTLGW